MVGSIKDIPRCTEVGPLKVPSRHGPDHTTRTNLLPSQRRAVALGICRVLLATKSEMTYVPREQTVNALGTCPSVSALTEQLR